MCIEQDQKKKKSENIRPHEKKIKKKNHVFKPKNVEKREMGHFCTFLVLSLYSSH